MLGLVVVVVVPGPVVVFIGVVIGVDVVPPVPVFVVVVHCLRYYLFVLRVFYQEGNYR